MRTIARFVKEAFWDMPQQMFAWSYIIVVVFIYAAQCFCAPYTSPNDKRVKALAEDFKRGLKEMQDKA
jgi:hypothetical protein